METSPLICDLLCKSMDWFLYMIGTSVMKELKLSLVKANDKASINSYSS